MAYSKNKSGLSNTPKYKRGGQSLLTKISTAPKKPKKIGNCGCGGQTK